MMFCCTRVKQIWLAADDTCVRTWWR